MTEKFFMDQIARLKARFSERAFDPEFTKIVAAECITMQDRAFENLVTFLIGSRAHNSPPKIADFREGRINEEKKGFQREVIGAARSVYGNSPSSSSHELKPIGEVLATSFPGCKSVKEALEVARLKVMVEKANQEPSDSQENAVPFDFGPEPG
jgi:hypothetical protein